MPSIESLIFAIKLLFTRKKALVAKHVFGKIQTVRIKLAIKIILLKTAMKLIFRALKSFIATMPYIFSYLREILEQFPA